MSIDNQRMKWWEKYCNKDVNQDIPRNIADLRDVLRAALLRVLHAKVDLLDIEKFIDNIIQKIEANYSVEDIMDYILRHTPEPYKQKEGTND